MGKSGSKKKKDKKVEENHLDISSPRHLQPQFRWKTRRSRPQDAAEARQETHLSWGRAAARLFLRRLGVRKDRPHREDLSDGRVLFVGHGFPVPQVGRNKGLQKVEEEERKEVQG